MVKKRTDEGLLEDYYDYSDIKQKAFLGGKTLPTYEGPLQSERDNTIKKEGHKDDAGKPRYDLIPTEFLTGTADILEIGSRKYAPRNWEKGMDWGRPFGAMMRHMWAWWGGENKDPETGKSHLWHAACNLAFLVAYEARGIGNDTRNKDV